MGKENGLSPLKYMAAIATEIFRQRVRLRGLE
jgi:hypothetical protein